MAACSCSVILALMKCCRSNNNNNNNNKCCIDMLQHLLMDLFDTSATSIAPPSINCTCPSIYLPPANLLAFSGHGIRRSRTRNVQLVFVFLSTPPTTPLLHIPLLKFLIFISDSFHFFHLPFLLLCLLPFLSSFLSSLLLSSALNNFDYLCNL